MSEKENQMSESKSQHSVGESQDRISAVDESRRRFSRSGLAVSGVLLTLASRPALAGQCLSPSGFQSGNVSHHGTPITCSGRTPGYWGTHPEEWPSPYDPGKCKGDNPGECMKSKNWEDGTKFSAVFNCSGHGNIYAKKSMMQVILSGGGDDPQQLGGHIVSALLNAKKGWTPVLTETQVIGMFNEWNQNGYFEPTAGVKWYAEDIVTYLKSTMPL